MTEDKKHQLDELSMTDILSYLGARASDMEEHIRRTDKRLSEAKEIIKSLLRLWNDVMTEETVKAETAKAEQFLKEYNNSVETGLIPMRERRCSPQMIAEADCDNDPHCRKCWTDTDKVPKTGGVV